MAGQEQNYRFEIAISFAGDNKRDRVRQVAEILRGKVGDGRVFFDEWFEAEIAGHDADVVLQRIYREQTRLVVTCVCQRYREKPWTQFEWRAIRAFESTLRDGGSENFKRLRLLPVRFGDGNVYGLFSEISIVPDVRERSPEQIAKLILDRLKLAKGETAPAGLPSRDAELRYLKRLRAEIEAKAALYSPLRGVVTEDREKRLDELLRAWKDDPAIAVLRYRPRPETEGTAGARRDYDDVLAAFGEVPQAALLGEPGSGKSTTLRKLALDLATKAEQDDAAPLPLLAALGDWQGDEPLEDFLVWCAPEIGGAVKLLSQEKRLVLLLDGLNEVPAAQRAAKASELVRFKGELEEHTPFIVSCRVADYGGDLALRVDSLTLDRLSPQRVRAALRQWVFDSGEDRKKADGLFWKLAGDAHLEGLLEKWLAAGSTEDSFWSAGDPRDDERVSKQTSREDDELWRRHVPNERSLLRLAANPFMLTMFYVTWRQFREDLPANRGDLFSKFVETLLLRERLAFQDANARAPSRTPEGQQLADGLAALAWRMQRTDPAKAAGGEDRSGAVTVASRAEVVEDLGSEALLGKALAATLLEGGEQVRFRHQLLQEYFAARGLEQRLATVSASETVSASDLWPADRWWERSGWEETCVLLAGFYPNDCAPVVRWLADGQPEVAAQCIERSGAKVADEKALRRELSAKWKPRLTDVSREPWPEARAAIGRAMARLDLDDRKGVGLRADGAPDIDWVAIEGGTFLYGDERKPRQVGTFWIARYPVTNKQFQAFLDAEDGYRADRWWRGLSDPDRNPRPPAWNESNHPRETVSWHEAMAFCAWAGERLGFTVTLPTELQWERAARSTDGRRYASGDDYISGLANINESSGGVGPHRVGRTTPVGIYPHGASMEAVADLAGNVWEWCLNEYATPKRTQIAGVKSRVLRGGSWGNGPGFARADARDGAPPGLRFVGVGFRVVCSSPIAGH